MQESKNLKKNAIEQEKTLVERLIPCIALPRALHLDQSMK